MTDAINKESIVIAQVTDAHLTASRDTELNGINTYQQLKKVLDHLNQHDYDILLLTGDLSQDGTKASYQLLAELLSPLDKDIYCIAGNHDNGQHLFAAMNQLPHTKPEQHIDFINWTIYLVNTNFHNRESGFIRTQDIEILQKQIAPNPAQHIALVTHHHFVKVGTPAVDRYVLQNPQELLQLIDHNPRIKLCINGHVHNDYYTTYHHTDLQAGPATCYQISKGANKFAIESRSGYKRFRFTASGYLSQTIWIP